MCSLLRLLHCDTDNDPKKYPGKLHLAVDGWTAPNVFSFLGITVHRAVAGEISSFILDFVRYVYLLFSAMVFTDFILKALTKGIPDNTFPTVFQSAFAVLESTTRFAFGMQTRPDS